MVEMSDIDRLPICGVVALGAIRPQAALVLVGMAGCTGLREAQKSVVQVSSNADALGRRNL
jgi:hypothetical protein